MKNTQNRIEDYQQLRNTDYLSHQFFNKWIFIHVFLLIAMMFIYNSGFSQSLQSNAGQSYTNMPIAGSTAQWVNLTNTISSNNVYTVPSANLSISGDYTDYLIIEDFQYSIPSGSTITGIIVNVERSDANGKSKDSKIRLIKNGVIGTTDKSINSAWSGSDYTMSYGGSSDLWGQSWSAADINAADFGIAFAAQRTGGGPQPTLAKVDQIFVTVYYNDPTPLPVQLIYFDGELINNSVKLSWRTESEINNDFFTILKSTDGLHFSEIQKLSGAGTTSISHFYSYTDENANQGISYYRLKQTDYDGNSEFFKIISVTNNKVVIDDLNLKVMPTIFKESFVAHFELNETENVQLQIINMNGTVVQNLQVQAEKGINNIQVEVPAGLQSSTYLLRMIGVSELIGQIKIVCMN